jgi:hypothetical protein
MDYTLQPRIRTYKPRIDKSGFSNKTVQKEKQRQAILEEQYRLHRLVTDYIQNGILDFRAITRPLTPDVRNVFLSWISMANLSLDKHGRTEYGQIFSLQRRGEDTCQLVCTDGVLIMPDYILIFQEEAHV